VHKSIVTALALTLAVAGGAAAGPAPDAAPSLAVPASKNPAAAPAGSYTADTNHSSIIARVTWGGGFSWSVVRWGLQKATLNWDPANIGAIKLEAVADAKAHFAPITYNVTPDGELFLNAAQFPTITFVSTGVRQTGPTTAEVTGDLTIKGQTKPAVIRAELVGAGRNAQGRPIVGFTGTMVVNRHDYGITFNANTGRDVELILDATFVGGA
jgi:polyisoprenoid-binding protein YceI